MEEAPEALLEGQEVVEAPLEGQAAVGDSLEGQAAVEAPLEGQAAVEDPPEGQEAVEDLLSRTEGAVFLILAEVVLEGLVEGVDHSVLAEACSWRVDPQM